MKIYVNEIPEKPEDCLFSRKEKFLDTFTVPNLKKVTLYEYYCNINNKKCNIDCGGKCNKLRVLT